ncbi:hypothetical protein A6E15_05610 [Natrinema saccharevitans]|uniref:Uncharacterized protein n=1 Tax=Natrinema saccharevitans TaxID=301967 RepID=A0A1S8AV74_9EURY|nr:zinc-binding alcohol dehydrogenase family protein [Natrinema saccharevitans]OLZ40497.1 hypothetical protein A6E15_05610 [Natrinema saccharevitans]
MRAAAFTDLIGPEGVRTIERDESGPGEAAVDVAACAINRHDRWILEGDRLVSLPDGVDATTATVIPTADTTAFHMLRWAEVGPGAAGGEFTALGQSVMRRSGTTAICGRTAGGNERGSRSGRARTTQAP